MFLVVDAHSVNSIRLPLLQPLVCISSPHLSFHNGFDGFWGVATKLQADSH